MRRSAATGGCTSKWVLPKTRRKRSASDPRLPTRRSTGDSCCWATLARAACSMKLTRRRRQQVRQTRARQGSLGETCGGSCGSYRPLQGAPAHPTGGFRWTETAEGHRRAGTGGKRAYDRRIGGLSVIIPATNLPETLDAVIAAIESAAAPTDELIVVRNASRPGPAAARNEGAGRATRDVLVFVDADVEVHADALERIGAAFADDASLAAVFGAYDDAPREQALVSSFRNLLHHYVHTS